MEVELELTLEKNVLLSSRSVFIRSLHDVHELNAYRPGLVCLSVRTIKLENRWTDLDEIWYGRYATGNYPKTVQFPTIGNTDMADEQDVRCD
jgi:hypothetical protein